MKVTVIGAGGSVGGPAAFYTAVQRLADEILLIDVRQNVAEQHAIDLGTAVSALGVKVAAGTAADMAGSDIVLNAAGALQGLIADRMELLGKNLSIVKGIALDIKEHCPGAFVITATNPVDPLNYATWSAGGFDRRRSVGYSLNDSARFREMVARKKGVEVGRVQATVVGEHGSTQVYLFSSVRIDGQAVSFTEDEKAAIRAEIPGILKRLEELQAGRTAGWSCAVGIASLIRAIAHDTGEVLPCSVVLDGEYGLRDLSISVPVRLGKDGVREVEEWELTSDERAGFERSADAMAAAAKTVRENL
jgi:malate/lactate dehydrogenase